MRPGRTLEEAHAAVDEVLNNLRKKPPTKAELKRARNSYETHILSGLEKLGGFSGRAELLQRYNNLLGDPGKLGWDLERYRKPTTKDIKRAFDTYLTDKRLVVYATPSGKKGAQQ